MRFKMSNPHYKNLFNADISGAIKNRFKSSPFPLLKVENLCKSYRTRKTGWFKAGYDTLKAVDHISFEIYNGEVLGLVGESGCGKSTTGRCILHAIEPDRGKVIFDIGGSRVDLVTLPKRLLRKLRTSMQMIFQDPYSSLNPRMTVREIVREPLFIHNLASGQELENKIIETLKRVGLEADVLNRYPHAFSGGQRQRISIARALIGDPSFIIADEPVTALDVSVQAQIINLLKDLQEELSLTYLFISHDLSVIKYICNRIAVMYAGRIVEIAETSSLFNNPQHPYTKYLLASIPSPDPDNTTGDIKPVYNQVTKQCKCAFASRCSQFNPDTCSNGQAIELKEILPGHSVACLNVK